MANNLEQELENLDVPFGLRQRVTPGVEPVAPQQDRMGAVVPSQCVSDAAGETPHVLVVFQDWNPFPMLVGRDALEPLEHLVARRGRARLRPRACPRASCSKPNACARRRPAARQPAISRWMSVSADARADRVPITPPRASQRRMSEGCRSRFETPLAVIASSSGTRERTALKLPLVPRAQPRA